MLSEEWIKALETQAPSGRGNKAIFRLPSGLGPLPLPPFSRLRYKGRSLEVLPLLFISPTVHASHRTF